MKNAKQKEEKYKNTNKMSVVRIMTKIIIQIYNNLQVRWSSQVKFVSLPQLLGGPPFGSNSGLFTVAGFIVSLVGIKKKRQTEEEIKREKEGVEQESRKERKKVLKEQQKIIIIIKNYFKKKCKN